MQQAIRQNNSRREYLALEEQSPIRHEFFQGQVFAMGGGTLNHSRVACNIVSALTSRLRDRPCHPTNSDMRIQTPAGLDTYPDVAVYCGEPELMDEQRTLLNPVVIFEVLSPSTRDYDRGDKFALYRSIPGLLDYVLADSDIAAVEHFHRIAQDEWILREYRVMDDKLLLSAIDVALPLAEIYQDVNW